MHALFNWQVHVRSNKNITRSKDALGGITKSEVVYNRTILAYIAGNNVYLKSMSMGDAGQKCPL